MLHENFSKVNRLYEAQKKENLEVNKSISKDRLEKVLKKKLTTTFIGALDSFEKQFGYLWQHGEPYGSLTENQQKFRDVWNEVRNEVLNKGNAQLRATLLEIAEYEVLWKKKNYFFEIKSETGANDEQESI
jgi:hypothetical protein